MLLACPPEEGHDLGLRMVADRFDMAGWTTYYLGPDTPVEEIADAARRLGVDAVVMSASTHFHRLGVRHAVDALKKALPNVDIWVGGPAFVGAATGWLPQEIVDLDELLGGARGLSCAQPQDRRPLPAQEPGAVDPHRRRHRRRHRCPGLSRLADHQPAAGPRGPDHRQQPTGHGTGRAAGAARRLHAPGQGRHLVAAADHHAGTGTRVLRHPPRGQGDDAAAAHGRRPSRRSTRSTG